MTLVIIKYIVVLVVVYGIAWMLNKKYFNEKPLSSGKSFLLMIGMFIVLTVILTALMHYINYATGTPTKKIFDFSSIWFALVFGWTLNTVKKIKFLVVTAEGNTVATFKNKPKAEKYLADNLDKNYSIKEQQ